MQKRYIVRLSESEKSELHEVIKRLNGSSQKVRRAQILLKADAEGPNWTDQLIAEAFNCRPQTVENIRRRLGEHGFEATLNGLKR
uniref:helix-turn-helix domain-containing protein n=1 Tax=Leptolyngbya sp. BC1307 TaxID=2029589 RepID=UPI001482D88F